MHRVRIAEAIVALALATAACQPIAGPPRGETSDAAARLNAVARKGFDQRRLPGMAVTVLRGGDVVLSRGYGGTDLTAQTPIDDRTVFQLGSVSKQFLAALVVALAADGKLSLDEPVSRHLPGFHLLAQTVSIRNLLTHTSGIRELFQLPGTLEAFADLTRTRTELMATVRGAPVDFPPGSRWSYSNTNYTLLAALVEAVTGRPYEDLLADRFFAPLRLTSLRQCTSIPKGPSEAIGHLWRDGNHASPPENMEWIRGDGGLCGSARDLARWTHLLASGQVIPPAQYSEMTTPTRLTSGGDVDYGFGLALARPDGVPKVSHGGAMQGFSAQAAYYPESSHTVVVLTNRGDVRADAIEREIARSAIGLTVADRSSVTLTPAERSSYVSTYDIGVFDIHVVERDGRLWLEMPPPGPTTPLRYVGDGMFLSETEPDGTSLSVTKDRARVRLYMGAMHWYGDRRLQRR